MPAASSEVTHIPEFDFDPRTRLVFGAGAIGRLGQFAREIGGRHALLVSDPGLKAAGHEARALSLLESAGIDVSIFDDVHTNPTSDDVDQGAAYARNLGVDHVIGLGGGSSMDCAKGINFLLTNGGKIEDYHGVGKAKTPLLPMIAVPTTAGTGSEAQSYAVISHAKTHQKMACGDKSAAPRIAILDPELTLTMPASVTAITGIDAISHAVESYVTTKRNPISQLFARRAWRLLTSAFPVVVQSPDNITARGAMLLGAHLAGAAIENSMLGATHALANPITAHFGVTHGVAIGVLLPHVVRYNGASVERLYRDFADDVGMNGDGRAAGEALAGRLQQFVELSGGPTTLNECGVDRNSIPELAREAAQQWTGKFNPRHVGPAELEELYQCAFQRA